MTDFFKTYLPNVYLIPDEFVEATKQTLYMSFWTAFIGGMIGIILGVTLVVTRPNGLLANRLLFEILDKLINIIRSIPFIILLSLLALTTRFLVGTTIGAKAALVPLIFGVVPFFARQIENALLEVDPGVIEAAEAMGTSPIGIILRVFVRRFAWYHSGLGVDYHQRDRTDYHGWSSRCRRIRESCYIERV